MKKDFRKDINNSFKEIQEDTAKQKQPLKEETNPLKKCQRTPTADKQLQTSD